MQLRLPPESTAEPRAGEYRNMTPSELAMALSKVRPGGARWHMMVAEQWRRERWPALIISVLALLVSLFALLLKFRVES
jgi:hypothetical protein